MASKSQDKLRALFWILVGAVFLVLDLGVTRDYYRFNDDFQYLSVADNLVKGNGAATSILYFDEHYASGTLPAPQTVFPCGYSLAVATVHLTGLPLTYAGLVVSSLSFFALIPLLLWGCRLLQVGSAATHGILFLVVASSLSWRYALTSGSEALFTALLVLAAIFLMRAEIAAAARPADGGRHVFLGGVCCGLCFLVRYAGSFLIAAGLAYYLAKA